MPAVMDGCLQWYPILFQSGAPVEYKNTPKAGDQACL